MLTAHPGLEGGSMLMLTLSSAHRKRSSRLVLGLIWVAIPVLLFAIPTHSLGQASDLTVRRLLQLSGPELDALYRGGSVAGIPPGQVRGTALLAPGTRRNRAMALGTRLVWQGKIIDQDGTAAVNRFFGIPVVRAQVYQDQSWLDGAPCLVLDYSRTSRIYARNRDEIRQIAPGLFLGLMYARTEPQPTLRMYFVLEVQH